MKEETPGKETSSTNTSFKVSLPGWEQLKQLKLIPYSNQRQEEGCELMDLQSSKEAEFRNCILEMVRGTVTNLEGVEK